MNVSVSGNVRRRLIASLVNGALHAGTPYVHAGFYRSLFDSTLYLQVRAAIRVDLLKYGNKPLYLSGHSLGASMAALAAPMLKHELNHPIINLYTFGCPRIGNIVRFFSNLSCERYRCR
jgi:predicted lipase